MHEVIDAPEELVPEGESGHVEQVDHPVHLAGLIRQQQIGGGEQTVQHHRLLVLPLRGVETA